MAKVPVFPAHAGMSRLHATPPLLMRGFPRSRGDEPQADYSDQCVYSFSPLTRG